MAGHGREHLLLSLDRPVEPLIPWDLDGLHSIPAFTNCMEALRAHPVIGPRLDTLVGSALGSSRLESDRIPDMVLYSMLPDADALAFEVERFDRAADELIAWLTRRQETYTVIAPLSGLITEANPIVLQAGIEIDEMTDAEVVDALTFGLAGDHPAMTGAGQALVRSRVGLRIREALTLRLAMTSRWTPRWLRVPLNGGVTLPRTSIPRCASSSPARSQVPAS